MSEQPDQPAEFKEARILRLMPGDKIILRHPDQLPMHAVENLMAIAEKALGCPVVVLSDGVDIDVLRKDA